MKSIKFSKKWLMLVMCLIIFLLVGCSAKSKAMELALWGEEQFRANDYADYVQELRNACGLSDLDITTYIDYYFEYDYDKKTKTLYADCNLTFTSDEIDNYYTEDYESETATELARVLNRLKNAYYKEPEYSYSSKNGTVVLKITNGVSSEIHVQTSSGRDYELSYYVNYDDVYIDGNNVYSQKVRDEDYSTNSGGYSASYDAKLKYGSGPVLICVSEDAMERFMTALNNGYQGTIDEMISNGEIAFTEENTKCNIVERKLTKAKVKLLDGSYAGNTVWVIIESIQEK